MAVSHWYPCEMVGRQATIPLLVRRRGSGSGAPSQKVTACQPLCRDYCCREQIYQQLLFPLSPWDAETSLVEGQQHELGSIRKVCRRDHTTIATRAESSIGCLRQARDVASHWQGYRLKRAPI